MPRNLQHKKNIPVTKRGGGGGYLLKKKTRKEIIISRLRLNVETKKDYKASQKTVKGYHCTGIKKAPIQRSPIHFKDVILPTAMRGLGCDCYSNQTL